MQLTNAPLLIIPFFSGWHNRLNTMARHGGVPFYKLVLQLRQEAEVVDVAVRSADLERESNRVYTALEKRIQKAWDEYMEGAWTTSHFLRAISSCYSPSVNTEWLNFSNMMWWLTEQCWTVCWTVTNSIRLCVSCVSCSDYNCCFCVLVISVFCSACCIYYLCIYFMFIL